jgi:DNA-binding Lrp family transcriptional regulator
MRGKSEKEHFKLKNKDREIIYELSLDARRPLSKISKNVGLSEQLLNYRIKIMKKFGLILGFEPIYRVDKLGLKLFRTYFRIDKATESQEEEIMDHLASHKNIISLNKLIGKWDISADFATRDINEFNRLISETTEKFRDNLRNYDSVTFVNSVKFKKKYLTKNPDNKREALLYGGEAGMEKMDNKNILISRFLSENAKSTNLELGKKAGVVSSTVKSRIRSMERRQIIQGYSARIDPKFLNLICKRILVRSSDTMDTEQKVNEFSRTEPNVVSVDKMIGKWNYEFCVECQNNTELMNLIRRMKNSFPDDLTNYEMLDVFHDYGVGCGSMFR